jgi:hypothetical protein
MSRCGGSCFITAAVPPPRCRSPATNRPPGVRLVTTGVEAETIQQLTIRNGYGLTGWVARNRRPLVNARPSTDFEAAGFPSERAMLDSALVCPLLVNERFIETTAVSTPQPSVHPDDPRLTHFEQATPSSTAIVFEQTREIRSPIAAELPNTRFIHAPDGELARAERLNGVSLLVMDLDLQDIQRHVRPPCRRPGAAQVAGVPDRHPACDITSAGEDSSWCCPDQRRNERKRLELQTAVDSLQFEARSG